MLIVPKLPRMDTKKLKQIQNQYYNEEDYYDENEHDELLQENTEDLEPDNEAACVNQGRSANNKISSLITQVDKGSSQPNYQQQDEIDDDFFVQDEIVVGPQRESDRGKKTLCLDLDETLVHSSFQYVEGADLVLPVEIDDNVCEVYVLKRPGVDEFLKRLHKHYELIIYTASLSKYADPLLDWLDPKNYCAYRLFREHCTYYNGIFVKDLSRIGRPLKDSMIIDNSPTSYLFHPDCAIPTVSWYDDLSDPELYQLCAILEKISKVEDVRPVLAQFISNNTVNFSEANRLLNIGDSDTRSNSQTPSKGGRYQPSPKQHKDPYKVVPIYTQDERNEMMKVNAHDESRTADNRTNKPQKLMTQTWAPGNKNVAEQFKSFTMMNQFSKMGLNMNHGTQKLLSETLSSYNPGGRNYMEKSKRSSKMSKSRGHSAKQKSYHSKQRKSPSRGRNDPNHMLLSMMKKSWKPSKSKHRKHYSNHDSLNKSSKRSRSRKTRPNNTPKRMVKYQNLFNRKAGSTRVSRKGSAANSNERAAYSTYVGRVSPKSKKKKISMDYDFTNTNSFTNMMNDFRPRKGTKSRQGMGSKKSSLIESVVGNSSKARDRAARMYSGLTVHTPTPGSTNGFLNDSKLGRELFRKNGNYNHQHAYNLTSTGRGKTPHQKPGSPKRRKHSSSKRSHSRPRSSKHGGASRATNFQAKFFDPKQLLNGYNMN